MKLKSNVFTISIVQSTFQNVNTSYYSLQCCCLFFSFGKQLKFLLTFLLAFDFFATRKADNLTPYLFSAQYFYIGNIFIDLMCYYLVIHFWMALTYHPGYLVFVTRVVAVMCFHQLRMDHEVSAPLSFVFSVSSADFGTRFWPVSHWVVMHLQFQCDVHESGTY